MTVPEQQDVAAIVASVLVHHDQVRGTTTGPIAGCGCGADLPLGASWSQHVAVAVAQELDAAGITTPVLPAVSGPEVWLVEPDEVHHALVTRADVDTLPDELTASRRDLAVWAALVGFTADALRDELHADPLARAARPTGPPQAVQTAALPLTPDPSWQPLGDHQQAGVPQWHADAWQDAQGDDEAAVPVFGAVPEEETGRLVPADLPPAGRCLTCPECWAKVWPGDEGDDEDPEVWLCDGERSRNHQVVSHAQRVMVDLDAELPELPEGAQVLRCTVCWAQAAVLPGGPTEVECDGSLHGDTAPRHPAKAMLPAEQVNTDA